VSYQTQSYVCPYCNRQAPSPGGVRFHVKLDHPESFEEFMEKHYPEMVNRFKAYKASNDNRYKPFKS